MQARAATVDDIAEIVRLAGEMFVDLGTATDQQWAHDTTAALTRRLGVDVAVFVVDHPDRSGLAAIAVARVQHSLPSPRRASTLVGYLEWVGTDRDQRRRGYATAATVAVTDWLQTHGVAVIDVHASAAAEPIYRALGFGNDGPTALTRRSSPRN